jgi:hypothetical protein
MKSHRADLRTAGGALAVVLALAALTLLSLFGGRQQPIALAQPAQSRTSTPTPPFISPLQPPTPTRLLPTPRQIALVTEPTEAWALIHRPGFAGLPYHAPNQPEEAQTSTPEAGKQPTVQNVRYLPIVLAQWAAWGKGVGKARPDPIHPVIPTPGPNVRALGVNWYYDWSHANEPFQNANFMPMIWCGIKPSDGLDIAPFNPTVIATQVAQHPGRTWLVYNEPDHPATRNPGTGVVSYGQCARYLCAVVHQQHPEYPCEWGGTSLPIPAPNPTVVAALEQEMLILAVDRYAEIYTLLKSNDPTAKVFCCGNFFASDTTWWSEFRNKLRSRHPSVKLDGVAIHAYPWSPSTPCNTSTTAEGAWSCLQAVLEGFVLIHENELARSDSILAPNAPIWLTEFGYLVYNGPRRPFPTPTALTESEVANHLMTPMISWMQSGETGYQAIAWYVTIDESDYTAAETDLFMVVNGLYVIKDPVGKVWATAIPVTTTP